MKLTFSSSLACIAIASFSMLSFVTSTSVAASPGIASAVSNVLSGSSGGSEHQQQVKSKIIKNLDAFADKVKQLDVVPEDASEEEKKYYEGQRKDVLYELGALRDQLEDASAANLIDSGMEGHISKMEEDLSHETMSGAQKLGLVEQTTVSAQIHLYAEQEPDPDASKTGVSGASASSGAAFQNSIKAAAEQLENDINGLEGPKTDDPEEQAHIDETKARLTESLGYVLERSAVVGEKGSGSEDILDELKGAITNLHDSNFNIGQRLSLAESGVEKASIHLFHNEEKLGLVDTQTDQDSDSSGKSDNNSNPGFYSSAGKGAPAIGDNSDSLTNDSGDIHEASSGKSGEADFYSPLGHIDSGSGDYKAPDPITDIDTPVDTDHE